MKRKITYSLSALLLAMIITISGVGNSYIKAEASSGVFDVLWNTDATVMENIGRHMLLWGNAAGCFVDPTLLSAGALLINVGQFYDWMISDGYSEEVANEVVHGGGGFVRDGITRDSAGNVTYSDEVSDLFYKYICNYLDTQNGYFVVESMSVSELPREWFDTDKTYETVVKSINSIGAVCITAGKSAKYIAMGDLSKTKEFVLAVESDIFSPDMNLNVYWDKTGGYSSPAVFSQSSGSLMENLYNLFSQGRVADLSNLTFYGYNTIRCCFYDTSVFTGASDNYHHAVVTKDGRLYKVWKNENGLKNYDIKNQNYFISHDWVSYDTSIDNSVTISNSEYQYYTDNSSTVYNNVQNIVNNSGSDLTEDDIQRIVEDELKKFKDNMKEEEKEDDNTEPDDNGGNSSGGGGSVSDNGTGGTGIGDFVGGLGSLLDFILSLLGKVIGLISDFLNSALELLGNLTSFTDGFSSFLTAAFGFLPEEAVTLICSGIALLITLGIIKYMRN